MGVLNQNNNAIDNVVLRGTDDAWVVTYDTDHWAGSDLPVNCAAELTRLTSAGLTIGPVALGGSGDWVVVNGTNQYRASGITTDLLNILAIASTTSTETISALAIGPDDSYVVVINQNDYRTAGVPASLTTYLQSAVTSGLTITRVALGTNGSWVVVTQSTQANAQTNTVTSSGIPDAFTANLNAIQGDKDLITGVALGVAGSFAVTYSRSAYYANATRAAKVIGK